MLKKYKVYAIFRATRYAELTKAQERKLKSIMKKISALDKEYNKLWRGK